MRNPERIDEIIEIIREEWKKRPDLRLHQFLYIREDPFYIEDYDLMRHLSEQWGFEWDDEEMPEYFIGENPWKDIYLTADKLTEKKKVRLTGKFSEKGYIP